MSVPKLLQFSNILLNLPKKAHGEMITCINSNENFQLCLVLFNCAFLMYTGLVSMGNYGYLMPRAPKDGI